MFFKTPLPGNISSSCFYIFIFVFSLLVRLETFFTPRVQINASSAIIIHPNAGKKHSAVFINLIHPGPGAAVTQIQGSLCTESPELTQDYLSAWPKRELVWGISTHLTEQNKHFLKGLWEGLSQTQLCNEPLEYLCCTFHVKYVSAAQVKPSQNKASRTLL